MRRLLTVVRRQPKHCHKWTYTRTWTGWLIARCDCGEMDLA